MPGLSPPVPWIEEISTNQRQKPTAGPCSWAALCQEILKSPGSAGFSASLVMGPDFVSLLDTDPNSLSLDKTKIWQLTQVLRPLEVRQRFMLDSMRVVQPTTRDFP